VKLGDKVRLCGTVGQRGPDCGRLGDTLCIFAEQPGLENRQQHLGGFCVGWTVSQDLPMDYEEVIKGAEVKKMFARLQYKDEE